MENISMVTGANGHLGNNLVRSLLAKGKKVRAGVRNTTYTEPFRGLDCEVVYTDLLDRESIEKALKCVQTLYQVAAVFKHWSKDPEAEIIRPNLEGTKNIIDMAKKQGVKRIIYVSSIVALDKSSLPINESTWAVHFPTPYYRSKTESEQLALQLAEKYNLSLTSVLPSALIGPNCFGHLTPTMEILDSILHNKQPIDVSFNLNFVDVKDVVDGMIATVDCGKVGERYILGTENPVCTTDLFKIARTAYSHVKKSPRLPKTVLTVLASLMEFSGMLIGTTPKITRGMVKSYYKTDLRLDISKSKNDLGYRPKSAVDAIKQTFEYLFQRSE